MLKLKVLWAVDAFEDSTELQKKEVEALRRLGAHAELQVDPTYVLSPEQLGVSIEFSAPWAESYVPAARKALKQKLAGLTLAGLGEPQILVQERPSLRRTAEALARHAAARSYDLILAGSHGRKGIKRLVLGSFAEELLLRSRIPVLIVGGHNAPVTTSDVQKPIHLLIPNDLSDPNSGFLHEVLQLAKSLEAKATLLSAVPPPIEPVFQSGVYLLSGAWVAAPVFMKDQTQQREKIAAEVVARAKERGVPCESVVDQLAGSVTESILKHARESGANFIVMADQSGPVATTLLGSITRQVVREAPCPVWVFRVK